MQSEIPNFVKSCSYFRTWRKCYFIRVKWCIVIQAQFIIKERILSIDVDIRPLKGRRSGIVAEIYPNVFKKFYFRYSCRVFLWFYFHFNIIIKIKSNWFWKTCTRRAIDSVFKNRVRNRISCGVYVFLIISPALTAEIRIVGKTNARREDMSYRLDFAVFPEF